MSILAKGKALVDGERQEQYGDPVEHWGKVADAWSLLLGCPVRPEQAVSMMLALKLVRQAHRHGGDNLADMAGYLEILDRIVQRKGK